MIAVVITGHGEFATGIKSMLELVLGECEHVHYVNFTEHLTSEDLKQKFQNIYECEHGNVLFLCDIAGGTPFNQAAMLMYEHGKNYGVLGGLNIPLVLDVLDQREDNTNIEQILDHAKITAYENIKMFGISQDHNNIDDSDGI